MLKEHSHPAKEYSHPAKEDRKTLKERSHILKERSHPAKENRKTPKEHGLVAEECSQGINRSRGATHACMLRSVYRIRVLVASRRSADVAQHKRNEDCVKGVLRWFVSSGVILSAAKNLSSESERSFAAGCPLGV